MFDICSYNVRVTLTEVGCRAMTLTTLFLDMNAYFASVEQQMNPELRGRPIAIAPVMADTSCCIAASYEAKAFGVRTGTGIGEARRRCPQLVIIHARPEEYVKMHHRIIEAVEKCLPVAEVCSIDEMYCRLMGEEKQKPRALELARQIKESIYTNVGSSLHCSVGVAPNKFLAKVATNLQKPDGLVIIEKDDLPEKLYPLELSVLPGIGRAMARRLHNRGVGSVEQLCALTEDEMASIWDSVIGRRWWRWLRGIDLREDPVHRRTVGHSHVLPPDYRTDAGARAVLIRLLSKAAMRLRSIGYWTRRLHVSVRYRDGGGWGADAPLGCCQDTFTMLEAFATVWEKRPRDLPPFVVGVTLEKLVERHFAPLPLFPDERRRLRLSQVMDIVNTRYGRKMIYFGAMHNAIDSAPMRISFTSIPDLDLQA